MYWKYVFVTKMHEEGSDLVIKPLIIMGENKEAFLDSLDNDLINVNR